MLILTPSQSDALLCDFPLHRLLITSAYADSWFCLSHAVYLLVLHACVC